MEPKTTRYWEGIPVERSDPATAALAAVPDDDKLQVARALYVGTGGDISILPYYSEQPVTLKNIPNGAFVPMSIRKLMQTGTTASDILLIDPTLVEE